MKAYHNGLYPPYIDNPLYVVDGDEPKLIDNPDFISYEEWINEEVITQVAVDTVYDTDGITVLSPSVQE